MLPKFWPKPVRTLIETTLLVLMFWPAPIPVGHDHGDLTSQVSDQQLTWHLQCHHGGFANSDSWPTDWHWHWVFPADGCIGLGGEILAVQADQIMPRQRIAWLEATCVLPLEYVSQQQLVVRPSLTANCQHSFQHVALLHSRQSLPELLGVIRC